MFRSLTTVALLASLSAWAPTWAWSQAPANVAASNGGNHVVVSLTHPELPPTVNVSLFTGSITVSAYSGSTVQIDSQSTGDQPLVGPPPPPAPPGMHRVDTNPGASVSESNNVITVGSSLLQGLENLTLQVPAHASLNLHTMRGDITVTGVAGNIEVNDMNGDIMLKQVTGSVVADAMRGKLTAALSGLDAAKPSSFSSLNGDIDVTLPADVHATLRLQNNRGSVFLDNGFAFKATTNVGGDTADAQAALLDQLKSAQDLAQALAQSLPSDASPQPSPRLAIPMTFVGTFPGSSISGTLNGGGPEIRIQDFRGNIYLHKGA